MSFSRGDRVRILIIGTVQEFNTTYERSPSSPVKAYQVLVGPAGLIWVTADDIELINEVHNKDGWRDICADMIRLGRDKEAVKLMLEKGVAKDITPVVGHCPICLVGIELTKYPATFLPQRRRPLGASYDCGHFISFPK